MRKYYTSIKEMPIGRWSDFLDTGELKHFLKKGRLDRFAIVAYQNLNDQLIDSFGISDNYMNILKETANIEAMYARQIRTGDRSNRLLIDVAEIELERMKAAQPKGDFMDSVVYIEKEMGFPLDPEKTTVYAYYNYSRYLARKQA